MTNRVDEYIKVVPSERQRVFSKNGFNIFVHYGINTFIEKEWSDGKAPASDFNPENQDTDQWVKAFKEAGATGVILTAKHHDGFCLWQTKTTEYSVKNSPYKDGKGDVVAELSESCKKAGLKFGFYLSPWDRNSEHYGTPAYDDFYIAQLTELLTNYGDIFCIWLDGACGSHLDGKAMQKHDFERYYSLMRDLQPNCVISNSGPDIRWVGNEAGYARESEWNVVPANLANPDRIAEYSQQSDGENMKEAVGAVDRDLGSRTVLEQYNEFAWYPAEVDVSIRPGWFYHAKQDGKVRTLNNLLQIYYASVGGNSLLLLNIPPDKRGLISEADKNRLAELGTAIRAGVAKPALVANITALPTFEKPEYDIKNVLEDDDSYFTPDRENVSFEIDMEFKEAVVIDKVQLKEDTRFSQRIEEFEIHAFGEAGERKLVYSGTTVGFNKIAILKKPTLATKLRITIVKCRRKPYLGFVRAYVVNGQLPKAPWYHGIKQAYGTWKSIRYERKAWKKRAKDQFAMEMKSGGVPSVDASDEK